MPHLPPGAGGVFLIQVQADLGNSQGPLELRFALKPKVTQQIRNRCRTHDPHVAQGEIAHRAHRLLELAGHTTALAGVIAVVRPRRQLIDI